MFSNYPVDLPGCSVVTDCMVDSLHVDPDVMIFGSRQCCSIIVLYTQEGKGNSRRDHSNLELCIQALIVCISALEV